MDKERAQDKTDQQQADQPVKGKERRPGAFNERGRGDEKSTTNVEEEVELEQKKKQAMTERD